MKRPSNLSKEQIEKLPPKRLKAYKNKLLDYRRNSQDLDDILWAKEKIAIVQEIKDKEMR